MAVTQVYKVLWHWENSGKIVNHMQLDYVQAADNTYNTLKNVIVGNQGHGHGGATMVIDSVLNVGPGNIEQ